MPAKPLVIALEEHFQHPDIGATYGPLDANRAPHVVDRLQDLGAGRIKEGLLVLCKGAFFLNPFPWPSALLCSRLPRKSAPA